MKYPNSLEKLIKGFEAYPGIGPKTAERLAFFTVNNMTKESAIEFSNAIKDCIDSIKNCKVCGCISDEDICPICNDFEREPKIMVVEGTKDVLAFEHIGGYNGKYHVLGGVISPMNGVGPDDINIESLISRIDEEKIEEVILSLSSTTQGEVTSLYIKKRLEEKDVKVYRIGYGLPVGASIEYLDEITLSKALEGKRIM